MPITSSNRTSCLQRAVCSVICFAIVATVPATRSFAQGTTAQGTTPAPTQTQSQAQTAPDAPSTSQPPKPAINIPGAGVYNLMQEKSLVFPDIASSTEPLSSGQKFELFVDNSISVHTVTWAMLGSAVGQADNSPTGFGQGWDAYASRFGSSMARQASNEFFGTFVLASALHEDPRFYPEIRPSFFHAVKYSVQRVFITRNDDGSDGTNWHGLVAPALAEGLANAYWPDRNRTVGDTFYRYGLDLATRAGGNMLREYWPVFYSKMHHASHSTVGGH